MKKRFLGVLITLVLLCLCAVAGAEIISGSGLIGSIIYGYWGSENITWDLDTDTGVMHIYGTGGWGSYSGAVSYRPWSTDDVAGSKGDYSSSIKTVIIQDGIMNVAGSAFAGCSNLTSISIPSSVTQIDDYAFSGCSSLRSITLPGGLVKIADHVFRDSGLTDITIPNGVSEIGEQAFYRCSMLQSVTLPDKLAKVEKETFYQCSKLTGISIPDGATEIGENAFYECEALMTAKLPAQLRTIADHAFYGCTLLTSVNYSPTVISTGKEAFKKTGLRSVETYGDLGYDTFRECPLTSVVINNCSDLGPDGAFYKCAKLSSLTFNNCSFPEIPRTIFEGCPITSVSIPATVTKIGERSFKDTSLTSVVLPDRLITIEKEAFKNTLLTSVTIPSSVIEMGTDVFRDCSRLTSAVLSGGVGSVPDNTFWNCPLLSGVTIPAGTLSLGDHAFCNCAALRTVALPDGLGIIGEYCFEDSSLCFVRLPLSLQTVEVGAFQRVSSLTDVFYAGNEDNRAGISISSERNGWLTNAMWHYNESSFEGVTPGQVWKVSYKWSSDCTKVTGTAVCTHNPDHIVKETVETEISVNLYDNEIKCVSKNFETFLFKQQSKTVKNAFTVGNLKYALKSKGRSVSASKDKAVQNLSGSDYDVAVTGIVKKSVAKVTIPATVKLLGVKFNVTTINDNVFKGLSKLTTVSIGKNVKSIGQNAFKSCTALKTVSGGSDVATIGSNAFLGCKRLASFPVMGDLTSIGASAFKNCVSLKKFTLGSDVNSIGSNAFYGCKALKTLTIKTGSLNSGNIGSNAFKGIYKKATIKCPSGKKKEYKALLISKGAPKTAAFK